MRKEGIVVAVAKREFAVVVDGRRVACTARPRVFDAKPEEHKNAVAVGDRVEVVVDGERGVIERVLPRRNALLRPLPGERGLLQVAAANVDRLVIVVATRDPPLRTGLVDRYLVAAARDGMEPLLVVNKCDRGRRETVEKKLEPYFRLGLPIVFTSALTGEGVAALCERMRDGVNLLVGHSGVGKSSLVNRIDPSFGLKVGGVARHGRGRHTTTGARLLPLPGGGWVVDTPGVRGFGLAGIAPADLSRLMPDLARYAHRCRFADCTHDPEPDCAVRDAVERGEIPRGRYESYLRMLRSLEGNEPEDDAD